MNSAEEIERCRAEFEQFARAVSHDLHEPLRTVTGYVQLLQRRYHGQLDEKADKYIEFTANAAIRMQNMLDALRDLSRVTTRGREPAPVESEKALEEALSKLRSEITESAANIVTVRPLPEVMADGDQLMQVFRTMIDNAITFRGDVKPVIYVSAERNDDMWQFAIRDNGIGIDPQFAERIFIVFQRLHTQDEYPGLGMGLSICKRIVERHGGRIWVDSEPGQGATFFFKWPACGD